MSTAGTGTVVQKEVWQYGRLVLAAGLVSGIAFILLLVALAPELVPYLPALPLGCVAAWFLFRRPALNLAVLLAVFPLVADFEEGLDVQEILFGLYYLSFLGHWYFKNVLLEQRRLLNSITDRLAVFILLWVALYVPLSFAFGGDPIAIRGEVLAFTFLGFYFPVKSMVARTKNGVRILFLVLVWAGLFVTVRNFALLQQLLSEATMAWQITQKGRIATNEILIVVPGFAVLSWALLSGRLRAKAIGYALFLILAFGLVMTQSRGYWVAFALGIAVIILALERRRKVELLVVGAAGILFSITLVFYLFGENALLLAAGLFNRILSLATAATEDISLINRFLESKTVLTRILENPVLGHGMGIPYSYHDPTIAGTRTRPFIHNGFLSLWYRFGIVGLVSVCAFWFISIRTGFSLARRKGPVWNRIGAMVAAASLTSLILSGMTSTPFHHNDLMLMFALLAGMATGLDERRKHYSA